jgi:hypothetical protein
VPIIANFKKETNGFSITVDSNIITISGTYSAETKYVSATKFGFIVYQNGKMVYGNVFDINDYTIQIAGVAASGDINSIVSQINAQIPTDGAGTTTNTGSAAAIFNDVNADNIIQRFVNSTLESSPYAHYTAAGFNEFDIIINADGDYEMVWDARTSIKYIKFTNAADLQTKVDAGQEIILYTGQNSFPSFMYEGGMYYLYVHQSDNTYILKRGTTISALAADAGFLVKDANGSTAIGGSDWSVRRNPRGGYISSGYISGKACVWVAPAPEGPWVFQNYVFVNPGTGVTDQPPAMTNQADGFIFFIGNRCFYMFNGFHVSRNTGTSHNSIVELDENYQSQGRPVEFIHQTDAAWHSSLAGASAYCYNAVFVDKGTTQEIFYVLSTGSAASPSIGWMGHITLSEDISGSIRNVGAIAKAKAGYSIDRESNIYHYINGTVSNTVNGGIQTSSANSGIYNWLGMSYLNEFDVSCRFRVDAFPSAGQESLIFSIGESAGNNVQLTVNDTGGLKLYIVGSSSYSTAITGNVSIGVVRDIAIKVRLSTNATGINLGYRDLSINGTFNAQIGMTITNLNTYSLLNDKTDAQAFGRQLNGAIFNFSLSRPVKSSYIPNSTTQAPGNFNILGTGEAYKLKASRMVIKQDDQSYNIAEHGFYNKSDLGVALIGNKDASIYWWLSSKALGNAMYCVGENLFHETGYNKFGGGASNGGQLLLAAWTGGTITDGATTPVPAGGAGVITYQSGGFYGWNGTVWKQLNNT